MESPCARVLSRLLACLAFVACALVASRAFPQPVAAGRAPFWEERFERSDLAALGWADPSKHGASALSRVYAIVHDGGHSFLHARHDATTRPSPPAMHLGTPFPGGTAALEKVLRLTWRWRVTRHPAIRADPWEDVAASVYVIMKTPGLLASGKGLKLGWLARPASGAVPRQRGIVQVELRHDAAGGEWVNESVDICDLFRRAYGPCEGERVLYVGVMTDADGTRSVAEADYADFALLTR